MTRSAPDFLLDAAALITLPNPGAILPKGRVMARTVEAFNAVTGFELTETEGWLFEALYSMSSAVDGGSCKEDLLYCAAQVAIALETELKATESASDE